MKKVFWQKGHGILFSSNPVGSLYLIYTLEVWEWPMEMKEKFHLRGQGSWELTFKKLHT